MTTKASRKSNRKVNVAVVGLGFMGVTHIKAYQQLKAAKIVAVCDSVRLPVNGVLAGVAGNISGSGDLDLGRQLKVYRALDELLADAEVDLVDLCVPTPLHPAQAMAALKAGKHVLCEKPMFDAVKDVPRLKRCLALAAEKGLVVSSCHPRRFDPPYTYLREELPRLVSQLGAPRELLLYFSYHAPSKQGLHKSLLLDHLNHEIDLVSFLFGESPFNARRLEESEVSYTASGVRQDGISFYFSGSRFLSRRIYAEWVELRFERGHIDLDIERGQLRVFDHNTEGEPRIRPWPKTNYSLRFEGINRNFIEVIEGGPSYLSAHDLVANSESAAYLHESGSYFGGYSSLPPAQPV